MSNAAKRLSHEFIEKGPGKDWAYATEVEQVIKWLLVKIEEDIEHAAITGA